MKDCLLVTLADKNYVQYAKQLFSSAYWNAGWDGDYMLLSHEIPESDLAWFTEKGILVRRCKPLYNEAIGKEKYPPVVFNLFYLFSPEFKKWKNIIFLDGDIIVRGSLKGLTNVKGFASPNIIGDRLRYFYYNDTDTMLYSKLEKEIDLDSKAFNCGVMAFSTDIIHEDLSEKLMGIFNAYQKISSGADPTLNQYFYKSWKKLPVIYDITPENIEKYTGIPATKIKGIIIHLKDHELADEQKSFYKEWKASLEKADGIDLNKVPKGIKWNIFQKVYHSGIIEFKYSLYLFHYKSSHFLKYKIKPRLAYIIKTPDRLVGFSGGILKKICPSLYRKLKKQ